MNMIYRTIFILWFAITPAITFAQNAKEIRLNQSNIKEIISLMTLEEKASFVVGTGMHREGDEAAPVIGDSEGDIEGASGYTFGIPRLGIRRTVLADGPAGIRINPTRKDDTKTYYATAWPIGALLASSWDTTLIKKVGAAFGNEIKEYGVDVILGPGMNIQRDPLNGRNFEYYSEDPFLTGHIAAAMVNGIQSNGVGTSLKHFAVNNQETARNRIDAIVSERALREIYLKGFEIAIKNSQPWSVMSAYNKVNGIYASENYDLLTTILRKEWGFNGFVVTDWYAGKDGVAQLKAGNDLIEPGGKHYVTRILKALETGALDEKEIDRNIEAILNVLVHSPSINNYKNSNSPDLLAHAKIVREAAAESMVLLKNESVLPFSKTKNIALFGTTSYNTIIGGSGSGDVYEKYSISIAEGLGDFGYSIYSNIKNLYNNHIEKDRIDFPVELKPGLGAPRMTPELDIPMALIEKSAKESDIAIFTIGRNAGEGEDRKIENDFNLSELEKNQIKQISDAFHAQGKKIVVLINTGGVIETSSWKNYADAILLAWQPGQEAGNSVADILVGKVNPSGKLTATFPEKYEDFPTVKNFPGLPIERPTEVTYEEDIYVGYRYFNSFNVKASYPFGYGLSYTSFDYSDLKLNTQIFKNSIKVSVTIKNTGKVEGKEVVQLYLSAPSNKLEKPNEELKGFAKTKLLKPGESQTITMVLTAKELASFNTSRTEWVADAGEYKVKIGSSCEKIEQSTAFSLEKEIVVEKVNKVSVPQAPINSLTLN
jgi:beta-glucosidase